MIESKTQVHKFWTEYRQSAADAAVMEGVDWVEYGPPGSRERTSITDRVDRLAKVMPGNPDDLTNPSISLAHARWDTIRPAYEAWKKGQDLPDAGTPLAAWNALSPEQADLLRMSGIRTVEEIAEMTDATRNRIRMPAVLAMIQKAKLFLASKDAVRVASALEKKDQEIAALHAQMNELMDMVKKVRAQAADPGEDPDAPKRRGRPPKARDEQEAA